MVYSKVFERSGVNRQTAPQRSAGCFPASTPARFNRNPFVPQLTHCPMSQSTWTETAKRYIDDIRECDDSADRFELIMELGDTLEPLPEEDKTEANRVQGCTAQVWLVSEYVPGDPPKIRFHADSDSMMVRGLAALLISHVTDKSPAEVAQFDFKQLADEFSLHQYLSPSRSNGLFAMSKRLNRIGEGFLAGDEKSEARG